MSKKLQNVKAVQQMLEGNHKFQTNRTVGFADALDAARSNEHHLIGDVWEETTTDGVTYTVEQRDGFRIRKPKNSQVMQAVRDEQRVFPNCRKDTCTCAATHHLDLKMQRIHGMCFDCTIEMEHELRKEGKYEEYEQSKIRENALAWLKSAERDVELLKKSYTEATKLVTNADGETETYSARMTPEEFEETVQRQFNEFKQKFLENLDKKVENEN
jgi:hypothetical protein